MNASVLQNGSLVAALFCLCGLLHAEKQTDRTRAAEGKTAAAPAVSAKKPAPKKKAAEEEPGPVTFCAWNLRNWLNIGRSEAERKKGDPKVRNQAETDLVFDTLAAIHPDILGICEMGSEADLTALQSGLKRRGVSLPHAEWVSGADTDRHLALLSRWPIVARNPQTALTYLLDHAELPVQRGFLDVTIQVTPDYLLRLAGAHLKSRRDVPDADEALMRRNEAHLLRRHLDTILTADPQVNLLVFGDFNETPDQPAVRAVKGIRGAETALTELELADAHGERWTYYFPEAETYSRIDYTFASRGILPEIDLAASRIHTTADWLKCSDHRPEVVVIQPGDRTRRTRTKTAK